MIIAQDLKSKMSYRADFFISCIGMLFVNISGYLSVWIIFQNFSSIDGWDYYEMLFLYAFFLIAITPGQCLLDNNWNLKEHIYSGEFIKYCVKPINIFFYYNSELCDVKGIVQGIIGVILLCYSWVKLAIPITILSLLKAIIGLLGASLCMMGILNFSAATSFYIMKSSIIMRLAFQFKDYAKYPITIFNGIIRFIFTFIFPVAFISYYPSLFIINPESASFLSYVSPIFGGGFFYLSYKFWMNGAKTYSGTGT